VSNWVCPCNGCKKAQKVIIDQIIQEYKSCINIVEADGKLYCYTWWKHDECEALRALLYTVTKDERYVEPLSKLRPNVASAMEEILNDPDYQHIMERLKYMEENGI